MRNDTEIWQDEDHVLWGKIAKNAEHFVDSLTDREDIAIVISPDVRPDAEKLVSEIPAGRFYPRYARMNINADLVFPVGQTLYEHISPEAPYTQRAYPAFVGTLVHESAHAKHTNWNLADNIESRTHHWVTLLEEIRCENRILANFPQYAKYVKVIVQKIVAPAIFDASAPIDVVNRMNATQNAILVSARADYGVFEDDELEKINEELDTQLNGDLDKLQAIWTEVFQVEDDDYEGLKNVASKIADFVDPDEELDLDDMLSNSMPCGAYMPSGNGNQSQGSGSSGDADDNDDEDDSEGQSENSGESGSDDQTTSEGNSAGGMSEPNPDEDTSTKPKEQDGTGKGNDVADILEEITKEVIEEISKGFQAKQYILPKSQHEKNRERREATQKAANSVKAPQQSTSRYGYGYGYNRLKNVQPNQTDISRMRSITQAIEKAHFRDITRTVTPSQLPPGRFVIREAMNRRAQSDNGQAITATPWNQIRRRSVENPPITLGILSDISGSMDSYQREVGSFTWALANAVQKLNGSVGAIAWNTTDSLFEMIKPRTQVSKELKYYEAGGGSNGLPSALRAIDGMLNLTFGEGVRVLAIITDGELPEASVIQKELDILTQKGVIVIWVATPSTYGGWGSTSSKIRPKNVTYAQLRDPQDFGRIVGPKIVEALASYQGGE